MINQAEWTRHWLSSLMRRDVTYRPSVYVRRRRAWLWRPLAAVGAVLLVWQVTSWEPIPLLVALGILMCLPWVADV